MKKLIIASLLSIFSVNAFSQQKGSFELGVNLGFNAATVQAGINTNSSYRSGVNLGVSADYFFSDRWSIKTKLAFDQKGWSGGFIDLISRQSFPKDYKIDYITVPVMTNWHFGKKRNWYLHFGPYLGFLTSANEAAFGTDLEEGMQKTDFGLDLGIGVKFPVSPKAKLFLELDGQSGFIDIISQNEGTSIMNSRSSINFGFLIDLKKQGKN